MFSPTQATITSTFLAALTACGGSGDLPPPSANSAAIPGSIEGNVTVGSDVKDATVNIYAFNNSGRGKLLSSTSTDDQGHFIVQVKSLSGVLLIESIGGDYTEVATNTLINIKNNQKLQMLVNYEEGQPLSVSLTPLNHLHKALVDYHLAQGSELAAAMNDSSNDIDALFDLDTQNTQPHNINNY